MSADIDLRVDPDGVALLRMQHAAGRNAFSRHFVAELRNALALLDDERISVAVIAGMDRVFSSGGDREVLLDLAAGRVSPYDLSLTRALLEVPVPTVAAMAGHAVGGGLVFGLAADIVLMARESRYGANFMDMGFTPGMGATGLLRAAVGEYVAAEMMVGGGTFRGARFAGQAGVNEVLPRAEVEARALELARRIAEKPRRALVMLKSVLASPRRRAFEEARSHEILMHELCFAEPATRRRIEEGFVMQRSES